MGVGNENTYGSKKNNHSFQHRNLQLLGNISSFAAGLATEATLQQVLAAIQDGQDYESKVVVDDNGNGTTYLEVRIWNPDTQTWELPLYYAAGSNSGVPASSLVAPIIYINPGTILSQIYTELLDQGLTLDAINLNTDNLEGLLTTIDGVLDLSLIELQAINANTDQLEALSTDIKNLLTTIDVDTGNIATSVAALELCCQATNTLLTTIDAVLDQIQTNTLNTVNELTSANVTLAAVQNELIALNNTAGTLATEATQLLILTELQGINLDTNGLSQEATQLLVLAAINSVVTNTTGLATEVTLAALNSKFNSFGREPEATSTPFAIDQEAYDALLAIQTAVQNIDTDLGTGGLALDTTVQATNTLLTTIDAVLDSIKVDTGAMVVDLAAIEVLITASNALLTTIDADTSAMAVDLAAIEVLITSTNALLTTIDADTSAIATSTANIDTTLTPASRTHNYAVSNGVGSVPAGSLCGSVLNNGSSAGTWNGNALPAGVSIPWSPIGAARDTYGAIAFDATGTEFIIEYTT